MNHSVISGPEKTAKPHLIMLISISDYWFNSLGRLKFPAILCCVQLDLIFLAYS